MIVVDVVIIKEAVSDDVIGSVLGVISTTFVDCSNLVISSNKLEDSGSISGGCFLPVSKIVEVTVGVVN